MLGICPNLPKGLFESMCICMYISFADLESKLFMDFSVGGGVRLVLIVSNINYSRRGLKNDATGVY